MFDDFKGRQELPAPRQCVQGSIAFTWIAMQFYQSSNDVAPGKLIGALEAFEQNWYRRRAIRSEDPQRHTRLRPHNETRSRRSREEHFRGFGKLATRFPVRLRPCRVLAHDFGREEKGSIRSQVTKAVRGGIMQPKLLVDSECGHICAANAERVRIPFAIAYLGSTELVKPLCGSFSVVSRLATEMVNGQPNGRDHKYCEGDNSGSLAHSGSME
jgi:hypothetical protein